MSTTIKQRRLLSMSRRSGSQIPPWEMDGRVQRHSRGWREVNLQPDRYDLWREAAEAVWMMFAVTATISAGVLLAYAIVA